MSSDLMANIQSDNRRWRDCTKHFFPHQADGYKFGERVRCANCGSERYLKDVMEYVRGYAASGADPRDVLADWKDPK